MDPGGQRRRWSGARTWRARAGLAATALLLPGCFWTQVGYGPEHRRHNPEDGGVTLADVDTLAEVWSTELGSPGAGGLVTEPIVADDRVYVTNDATGTEGRIAVHALDAATGAGLWERELAVGNTNFTWPTPVARSGNTLSVGWFGLLGVTPGAAGVCSAAHGELDPDDGTGTITSDVVQFSPTVTSGSVAVHLTHRIDNPGTTTCSSHPVIVRARNADSGAALWGLSMGPSLPGVSAWPTTFMPAIADGRVFVAWGPKLYGFRAAGCGAPTCQPTWTATLPADVSGTIPPVATNGGQVLVLTDQGQLRSYAAANGGLRWWADLDWAPGTFGLGQRPAVAVAGNIVYVTVPTGDAATPDRLLTFAANGCGTAKCSPLWTASDGPAGAPAVTGDVLLVGSQDAVLAYDAAGCGAATCTPVATIPVTGFVENVTIADGTVYASGAGRVTALAPTG